MTTQQPQDFKEEKVKEFFEKFPHLYGSLYSDWIRETIAAAEERVRIREKQERAMFEVELISMAKRGSEKSPTEVLLEEKEKLKQAGREEVIAEVERMKSETDEYGPWYSGMHEALYLLRSKFTP